VPKQSLGLKLRSQAGAWERGKEPNMTRETWQFINTFAPWFSAIGTLCAVIVSLYLARNRVKVRLRITAGHRVLAGLETRTLPEYLLIAVINMGFRPARITGVGWKVGLFKRQYAVQVVDRGEFSSPLPVDLNDGQEARYLIPFECPADWLNQFSNDFVGQPVRLRVRTLKLQVSTSIGKTFERKVEKNLRKKIIEAASK
jgi:hypothetical protein